jgi:hypothetical protein
LEGGKEGVSRGRWKRGLMEKCKNIDHGCIKDYACRTIDKECEPHDESLTIVSPKCLGVPHDG